jgi:hypothetical protein
MISMRAETNAEVQHIAKPAAICKLLKGNADSNNKPLNTKAADA